MSTKTQRPKKEKTCFVADVGVLDMGEENAQHPDKVIISLLNWHKPIEI